MPGNTSAIVELFGGIYNNVRTSEIAFYPKKKEEDNPLNQREGGGSLEKNKSGNGQGDQATKRDITLKLRRHKYVFVACHTIAARENQNYMVALLGCFDFVTVHDFDKTNGKYFRDEWKKS